MSGLQRSVMSNRLLRRLSEEAFQLLAPNLEPIDLPNRFSIAEAGKPIHYAYFLSSGIASIVAESPEGQRAEAGLFGREGWSPTALLVAVEDSANDIFMQVAGSGHRVARSPFLELLEASASFRRLLMLFNQTLATQTSYTALSNAVHHIDERLARWLLMCHDRVDGDEIALTHEFLSLMLAVRRPSVTTALHVLEGNRFIYAERGYITIRDRGGLEAFAADTYGRPEKEYQDLIGPLR
jgi:CRP-like cAMP-binding protein